MATSPHPSCDMIAKCMVHLVTVAGKEQEVVAGPLKVGGTVVEEVVEPRVVVRLSHRGSHLKILLGELPVIVLVVREAVVTLVVVGVTRMGAEVLHDHPFHYLITLPLQRYVIVLEVEEAVLMLVTLIWTAMVAVVVIHLYPGKFEDETPPFYSRRSDHCDVTAQIVLV